MTFIPLLFILGPSGVGKTTVADRLETDHRFLHLDIDQKEGFKANGLRLELGLFISEHDPVPLASALRDRVSAAGRSGAVLSFPSRRVLSREHITAAGSAGIQTVVLWGLKDLCKKAACGRSDVPVEASRYDRSNRKILDAYGRPEFADLRVEAFHTNGSRRDCADLTEVILARAFGS